MGFTTGFTGGITLTLSLAYLFVHVNQANRLQQSSALRSATHSLTLAISPAAPPPPPPSRLEAAAAIRPGLIQELKDKWNAEVIAAVRKIQRTDWDAVRDSAEATLMRTWHGEGWKREYSPEAWAQAAKSQALARAEHREEEAERAAATARRSANGAKEKTSAVTEEETAGLASRLQSSYTQAKEKVSDRLHNLSDKAHALEHQLEEKATNAVATAKARVHMAEEKFEGAAQRKMERMDDVEQALQQRYEPRDDNHMKKTAEEVIEERYKPVG